MSLDQVVTSLIYLVAVFIVFLIGKWLYDIRHRHFKLQTELLENDNFALAFAVVGYYLGIVFAIGGVVMGPAGYWLDDLIDILFYGIAAVVLLNLSIMINDRLILYKFRNEKEIIRDQNVGTGVVEAANHIAVGLIVAGAISGEVGDLMTTTVFWMLGQIVLIIAGLIYNWSTPFDIHAEIEKDNVAVGVAFAGVLIAIGNIVRIGISGSFISWEENLSRFAAYVALGFVLLPILRFATDRMLLPGQNLTDELVNQERPNVGAATIEAFSYVAASMLIGWVV